MRRPHSPSRRPPAPRALQRGVGRLQWIILLAVLAVAAAWGLPKLADRWSHDHSPEAIAVERELQAISQGLEIYKKDNGRYPSSQQGLLALAIKPTRAPVPNGWQIGGYVDKLPHDPWGNPYQYRANEEGSEYELFSFGKSGAAGGEDSEQVIRLH
ncbi:type II secretion system major pseudopilin GspG [Herbaspirillum lusitanum]|uniref:Type II secretion system major pseudopilin GspG n=1 Tax=Herbaspirillum lusitanum TaxID=213312 RepID=A0ABW9A9F4_9BURK